MLSSYPCPPKHIPARKTKIIMKELLRRLDRKDIRLAIPLKGKYPEGVIDWVNYQEERTIRELLAVGNVGLRTGIKVGNCYFCVLDLDGKG